MKGVTALVFAIVTIPGLGQVPCLPAGLVLTTSPPRLGDPWALSLSGSPNATGLLGFDLAPGPVAAPFGTVCLGLTPSFQWSPISLDAFGGYTTSGFLPANPALNGFGVFIQAAAADTVQPTGIALSNSAHAVMRPPRVFLYDSGAHLSLWQPGSWLAYDALSHTAGPPFSLNATVLDAAAIPALGWIAFVLSDGTLVAFDAVTGGLTMGVQVAQPQSGLRLALSGTTLIVVENLYPMSAALHFFQLPYTASQTVTVPLPTQNPSLIAPPGCPNLYVVGSNYGLVFPYQLATGTALPPISVGPAFQTTPLWTIHGGIIYLVVWQQGGPLALTAIDTSTNATLTPTPVPMPGPYPGNGPPTLIRYGPGMSGPRLLARGGTSLFEISPQTLTVTSAPSVPVSQYLSGIEPTNGGTEWLLVTTPPWNPSGPATTNLQKMNPATHAITAVGSVPQPVLDLSVLPSATLNEAFGWTAGGFVRFATDPTTSIVPVPVPFPPPPGFVPIWSFLIAVD